MPLIRGHHSFDDHFTQIPNEWLRDSRLSLKAIGLLAQIMSHKPGWVLSIESLARQNQCGKDQIRSAIKELEAVGYLERRQSKDDLNRFAESDWITCEPNAEKPVSENPTTGNQTTKKTITKEEQPKEEQSKELAQNEFEQFWNLYPRKVGKGQAKRAYWKAVGNQGIDLIALGVERFANDPNLPETQFIPYPATWLAREGWNDEPYPERAKTADEIKVASQKKLDKDKEHTLALIAEMQESTKKSSPAPKCPHGKSLVSCKTCLKALN